MRGEPIWSIIYSVFDHSEITDPSLNFLKDSQLCFDANEEQRHKELQSHLSESDYLDLMRTVESYKKACQSHEAQILQLEREFHARTQELTTKRNKYFRQIPHFWAQR